MSIFTSRIIRFAARKVLFDPRVRSVAAKVAREAAGEVSQIARDKDKARAAGRSFRRVFGKVRQHDDT